MMDSVALLALIDSDATAKALANAGNDSGCAERCSEIAPKVHVETILTERGLYIKLGAIPAETILEKLEAFALVNNPLAKVVARSMKWLEPANLGLDFGSTETLQLIDALGAANVLTADEVTTIKSMSIANQEITADQVSEAMKPRRS